MKYALIGLALVAAILGFTLWENQGSRLILKGNFEKVRTQDVDPSSSVAVVELRLNNPADLPYDVKDVAFTLETAKGEKVEGLLFHGKDLDQFLDFYKASLGVRYNDSLRLGERLKSHSVVDRTVAASFAVPVSELDNRKGLVIRLNAVDGIVPTLIQEKR